MTCNPAAGARAAHVVVALDVGPEVLTGSTRLKAGTATKLVLNALTTASFARLGRVYGQPHGGSPGALGQAPRARARGSSASIGGVGDREAARLLEAAGGGAKLAIVMARHRLSAGLARRRLAAAGGRLRLTLAGSVARRAPGRRGTRPSRGS